MSTVTTPSDLDAVAPAARPRRRRRITARTVVSAVTIAILLYLVLGPLVMLVVSSFEDTSLGVVIRPPFPWTLGNYASVFGQSTLYEVLGTTLAFSAGSLAIAFAVSLVFSWLIERTDMPLRNTVFVFLVAPSGIPALILAISWSLLLNPTNGFINAVIRSLFGMDPRMRGPLDVYSLPWMILVQGMSLVRWSTSSSLWSRRSTSRWSSISRATSPYWANCGAVESTFARYRQGGAAS